MFSTSWQCLSTSWQYLSATLEWGLSQCQSLNRSQCECGSIGRSARPVAQGMPLLSTTVQLRTRSCAYHGATTHPRAPTLQWAQAWTCRFSFQEIAMQGRCCACAEDLVRATQQEWCSIWCMTMFVYSIDNVFLVYIMFVWNMTMFICNVIMFVLYMTPFACHCTSCVSTKSLLSLSSHQYNLICFQSCTIR